MTKKSLLTLCTVALIVMGMQAQTLLKNDGAMLVVEPGATLVIQGGLENINGATIDNEGTIEVHGDVLNSATWTSASGSNLIFGGSTSADVTSGGAVFHDVEMNKTSGQNVNLQDDMTVAGTLTFAADNNKIILGPNDLVIQDGGSIASFDDNEFVVTDDVGYLHKEGLAASDIFTFPVGATTTTYNPATIEANGGHTTDVIGVRVIENLYLDGLAETDQATAGGVDAMWDITEGVAGGSDVDITLQWAGTDELPDFPAQVGVSRHDGSNWDLLHSQIGAPVGADPYTRTRNTVTSFGAFAVGGESVAHALAMSIKTFLQGAYTAGLMRDDLRAGALVPNDEPYTGAPYNYSHTAFGGGESVDAAVFTPTGDDAIVDWVVVELRDATTPTTILASKSALIQRDGDIVDLDGVSPLLIAGLPDGNYHIAVRHRNHLGIRTPAAQALSIAPLAYNFTTSLPQAYDNLGVTSNDAMVDLGSGIFGMWGGDANANLNTRYNGSANDKNAILTAVGTGTPNNTLFGVYHICDVNMNSNVRYNGSANDKNFVLTVVGTGTPNNTVNSHLD